MDSSRQRGKAELSTIVFFIALALLGWAAFKVVPVYYDHYSFEDKVKEVCRTPLYRARTQSEIKDLLMKATREARMVDWIDGSSFTIAITDTRRKITLHYTREVEILPGWKHTFELETTADELTI